MSPSPPVRTLHGRRILILEDNLDARELLQWTFQSLGAHALGAGNTELAQTLVLSRRPELIIADLALPIESGYDFVRWLRRLLPEQGGRTPCIAVTAYPDVFPEWQTRGFNGYMRKPLDIGALCNLVVSLLP
jgi:CheY-like chemotaxis protein